MITVLSKVFRKKKNHHVLTDRGLTSVCVFKKKFNWKRLTKRKECTEGKRSCLVKSKCSSRSSMQMRHWCEVFPVCIFIRTNVNAVHKIIIYPLITRCFLRVMSHFLCFVSSLCISGWSCDLCWLEHGGVRVCVQAWFVERERVGHPALVGGHVAQQLLKPERLQHQLLHRQQREQRQQPGHLQPPW